MGRDRRGSRDAVDMLFSLMSDMKIARLVDQPHFLRQIAQWNLEEWPSYYNDSFDKAIKFHSSTMTRLTIPTCLIASEGDLLVGTVSLVSDDMDIRPALAPWLASPCTLTAPFVGEELRGALFKLAWMKPVK